MLAFPHKYLEKMEESKFRILEDVKKLNDGNKYAPDAEHRRRRG